jgi:copper-binding protein NosD
MKTTSTVAVLVLMAFLAAGLAQATDISGTITSTLTITEDSQLTGDVTCTVIGAPCIKFGASDIELDLNGHVMTGNANPASCTTTPGERGIDTDIYDDVSIVGPGLVMKFREVGIRVGSRVEATVSGNHNTVRGVSITETCDQGMFLEGSNHVIEDNSVVRVGLAGGFSGIQARGTGHRIRRNEFIRAGLHGISTTGTAGFALSGAEITENNISGNGFDGIVLFSGVTGNKIERNEIVGNVVGDIFDGNSAGANDWQNNLCQTSGGTGAPTCPNLPNFAGHKNAGT